MVAVKDLFRGLVKLRRVIERVYGFSSETESLIKILRLQELLKKGLSVRRVLKPWVLGEGTTTNMLQ